MDNRFSDVMSQDAWNNLSEETRQYEIYRMLSNLDFRMCIMERRPLFEKCLAFLGGVVGGIAATLGIKML
jgi:hypothetical protein